MKVKEIMTKDVVSIKPDDSTAAALALLFEMQISGLPVIDVDGNLVGMFTEKDVLRYILPSYVEKVGRFIYEDNPKSTRKKFMELSNVKVSQLMRKHVITIRQEVTLCEVARLMLTERARRVPVVDESGKVIGIVARGDILKVLGEENA